MNQAPPQAPPQAQPQQKGLFSQLLSVVGISTGPSKEEQARSVALAAQQEAIAKAQTDHISRVQALNVSRGSLQEL